MGSVTTQIILGEDELDNVQVNYVCHQDGCKSIAMCTVGISFFEEAGTPICLECEEDMTAFSASIEIERSW